MLLNSSIMVEHEVQVFFNGWQISPSLNSLEILLGKYVLDSTEHSAYTLLLNLHTIGIV